MADHHPLSTSIPSSLESTESLPDYDIDDCLESCPIRFRSSFPIIFRLVHWGMPFLFCLLCNFCMAVGLHFSTYYYIKEHDHPLMDPVEKALGYYEVSMQSIDIISSLFPVIAFGLTLFMGDIFQWTKMLICHGVLAFLKGLLAAVSIVPDSIGWDECRARVGDDNIRFFLHELPNPDKDGPLALLMGIVRMELHSMKRLKPVRFCADMMFSGHTMVTCVYGLALVEAVRRSIMVRKCHHEKYGARRMKVLMWIISIAVILDQSFEIILVLRNRFHYTMDVIMALVLVALLYTNVVFTLAAKHWEFFGRAQHPRQSKFLEYQQQRGKIPSDVLDSKSIGDFLLVKVSEKPEAKAVMHRALDFGYALVDRIPESKALPADGQPWDLPDGLSEWVKDQGLYLVPRKHSHRRDGQLYVPVFCFPFSCFGILGRYHVVADSELKHFDPESDLEDYHRPRASRELRPSQYERVQPNT